MDRKEDKTGGKIVTIRQETEVEEAAAQDNKIFRNNSQKKSITLNVNL